MPILPVKGVLMVCENCLATATDEGAEYGMAADICMELGADIADHTCEVTEIGEGDCDCACRSN